MLYCISVDFDNGEIMNDINVMLAYYLFAVTIGVMAIILLLHE